jgi:hypothetical protein
VRAGLVRHAADWAWSSVRAHLAGKDDGLVRIPADPDQHSWMKPITIPV